MKKLIGLAVAGVLLLVLGAGGGYLYGRSVGAESVAGQAGHMMQGYGSMAHAHGQHMMNTGRMMMDDAGTMPHGREMMADGQSMMDMADEMMRGWGMMGRGRNFGPGMMDGR
jgi:hypothetical protein